ncbi:MAG: MBOAT family protein [Erysipelotrichales bacterium]|nr:MBOAT family protein [Erysipelotrichales bacterium]
MVFSSTIFLFLFLPCTLIGYYNPLFKGRKFRNYFLLLVSILFYAWGEPKFVFVILLSILVNYVIGIIMDKSEGSMRKLWLVVATIYNLSFLFVYKYLGFTLDNLKFLFPGSSISVDIVLPIGISFFTFQILSYIFDVYKREVPYQKNIFNLGLYISMFPQLIAGPIVRYGDVADEIEERSENFDEFSEGTVRFIMGLSKKVLLSNYLGVMADNIFLLAKSESLSMVLAWIGIIAYALQIYFDFSGYSDMAIGMGRMFGFHFLENFNYPYIAKNITDFWRRWHISLSTWFRDYVYIPLGGNRVAKHRHILNILCVWSLTGLWHGANWTFILWGLLYFVLLIFEKFTPAIKKLPTWAAHLYTLFFVCIAWVFFRAESITLAVEYISYMLGMSGNLVGPSAMAYLQEGGILLVIAMLCATPLYHKITAYMESRDTTHWGYVAVVASIFIFAVLICIKATYNPFIYFNF